MILLNKLKRRLNSTKLKALLNPHPIWLFRLRLFSGHSLANKKFLIIGGDSDIAKEFIRLLHSKNIRYIRTSRVISDPQRMTSAVYLDYGNIESFYQAIASIDTESLTDIVFFTGYKSNKQDKNKRVE